MMARIIRFPLLIGSLAVLLALPASAQFYGGERAGTAGFQSLQVPVDARGAALGQAVVTLADDASALFWNPALAAQATYEQPFAAGIATTRYHAETALHYLAGIARLRTPLGQFHLGLSLQAFDGGRMEETTELMPEGTGRSFGYMEYAAGLTVSQALTDLFSYGITAKLVNMSTADVSAQAAVLDLGIFYRVGVTGAKIGVAIRNFGVAEARPSGEVEAIGNDGSMYSIDSFDGINPPTQFLLGVSYDAVRTAEHSLTVAGQIANPADNQEQINLGVEYIWNQTLALRTGYKLGVDESTAPSFGFGFMVPEFSGANLRIDYGFTHLDRLGSVHRIGLDVRF
jgi:hypothetical protein